MYRSTAMIVVAAGFALPVVASAQPATSSDLAYCAALSDTYVRYIGHDETSSGRALRANRGDAEAYVAVAKCRQGDTAAAIPVLERKLTNARFTLPPRG
jgi:hypothetical protein